MSCAVTSTSQNIRLTRTCHLPVPAGGWGLVNRAAVTFLSRSFPLTGRGPPACPPSSCLDMACGVWVTGLRVEKWGSPPCTGWASLCSVPTEGDSAFSRSPVAPRGLASSGALWGGGGGTGRRFWLSELWVGRERRTSCSARDSHNLEDCHLCPG
jgi:hypothetical protein